jgi:genome maintenance exonuclease 1|tara:strand:- start:172 stop:828 length:657 start_codon:yes stop_codon:yes gene_type:complete
MFIHDNSIVIPDLECITTDVDRKYYTPEGKSYPSITHVLGSIGGEWLVAWRERVGAKEADRIGRQAALHGTKVHEIAEDYINNKPIDVSREMPLVQCVFAALKIGLSRLTKVYAQEVAMYSDHLQVAGRVDVVGEYDGERSIIDFKTSKRIKSKESIGGYWKQATAYAIMYEERTGIPITQLVIIMLVEGDNKPLVYKSHRDKWAKALLADIKTFESK